MKCPYCGSDAIDPEYVDAGVGLLQATPYECSSCHSVEIGPYDRPGRELTDEEKRTGWYAPQDADLDSRD